MASFDIQSYQLDIGVTWSEITPTAKEHVMIEKEESKSMLVYIHHA